MFNGFILSRKGSNWRRFSKKNFYSVKLFIRKKWIYGLKRKFTVKVIEMAKCVIFFPLCSPIIQLLPIHTHRRVPKWHAGLPTSEEHLLSSRGEQRHLGCTDSSPNSQAWAPRRREPTEALRKRNQLTPFYGFYLFLREKKNPHNYVIINEKIFLHYLQKQFIKRLGYLIGVSKMTF